LGFLFTVENLWIWIPGILFGTIVLIASRRSQHVLTYPILLTSGALIFYLVVWISGYDMSEIRAMGWLLGPFPQGSLWKPLDLSLLYQVDWGLIAGQAGNISAVALVSIFAFLLNASALELIAQQDVNLDRELISTGVANIAGGMAGSSVGYHHLGISSISFRMGISNRLVGRPVKRKITQRTIDSFYGGFSPGDGKAKHIKWLHEPAIFLKRSNRLKDYTCGAIEIFAGACGELQYDIARRQRVKTVVTDQ
jgi:hypothetical protein